MENELNYTLVYQWWTTSNYPNIFDKMADFLDKRRASISTLSELVVFLAATWDMISFTGKDGYLQRREVQNKSSILVTMKLEESY